MEMTRGPLDGVLVVAIEQAVAAPLATRTLADLGARVIKVENPSSGGDFTRSYDDVANGMAAHFVWLNRGKESVALDLAVPAAKEALHALLSRADVLVSNLGPGATGRMGLGQDDLAARHPRLVSVEISGYGSGGPPSPRPLPLAAGWPPVPARSPSSLTADQEHADVTQSAASVPFKNKV